MSRNNFIFRAYSDDVARLEGKLLLYVFIIGRVVEGIIVIKSTVVTLWTCTKYQMIDIKKPVHQTNSGYWETVHRHT